MDFFFQSSGGLLWSADGWRLVVGWSTSSRTVESGRFRLTGDLDLSRLSSDLIPGGEELESRDELSLLPEDLR